MKMNVPEAGRAEAGSLKITFILTISGLNAVSFRISGPLKLMTVSGASAGESPLLLPYL